MSKLIVASHNKGKVREFQSLLAPLNIEVVSLMDYPDLPEVEETGTSFEENALLKAETIANLLGEMVMADDSGLCVTALDGAPGVYSARYAGEPSNSLLNNEKLLEDLKGVSNRHAYFICCLAVARPGQPSLTVQGRIDGKIIEQATGDEGFGYDPLFYVAEEEATFAQMPKERKNQISHRARALQELLVQLPSWIEEAKVQ